MIIIDLLARRAHMTARSKTGWSDRVRKVAEVEYVQPARSTRAQVRIPFGDLKVKLVEMGFPQSHANQVASPLESQKFWGPLGLELCTPKGQSRTVDSVLEFRFVGEGTAGEKLPTEGPAERAHRLTEKMRGLLKEEIAAYGGAEGFIRWVRSEEGEA
jgi:hypothetical protein